MAGRGEYSKVGPYILLETLGSGSFGKVKLAVHETTHERFACKILDKSLVRQRVLNKQVKKEISIMQTLNHRNTVSVVSVLSTHSKVFLVMELVSGGELFDEILRHRRLSEPYARFYFQQLIDGLQHCHEHGVYHRDLKPENLLLDENKTLKITDFGLSTLCSEPGSVTGSLLLHTRCGTPNYVAPEMIIDEPIGYSGAKVDVWSCGIILFVLIAGALPFDADDTDDLFARILRRDIKYPPWFSSSLKDLIGNILADPEKRYSLADIRRHPWFNGHIEKSMGGESLEPTFTITDFPAPVPPAPVNGGVTQSPDMTLTNPTDYAHPPGSTQPGQASLLSQYVHMPSSGGGQPAAASINRRADSLDFGIRADSEDGHFGNHSESGVRQTDAAPILPAAISENPLPDNHAMNVPSNAEMLPPINASDAAKSHIGRFRSRVFGQGTGSPVQSSDDDHESEFEDAQEVGAPHHVVGNTLNAMKESASHLHGTESRRRGNSWNQDFLQRTISQGTVPESDELLSRSSDGGPSMRRLVQRELWNHDAGSWKEPSRPFDDFGDTSWNYENTGYRPDEDIGEHFSTKAYRNENGRENATGNAQEGVAEPGHQSAEANSTGTTPSTNDQLQTEFVTRTSRLARAFSHDGIALSAKTRRRPRLLQDVDAKKNTPILTCDPRGLGRTSAQKMQPNDDTQGTNCQDPQNKKILRTPTQLRPQKRERTRRNTVRFTDIGEQHTEERRGCESDRDWVASDVGKMLWCRMMKDYDMIPDADEFDMDSLALNELWTSGLQRERIGRPRSFAAQRFGSRRLTATRSTQYLSSQVLRSEVERWGSLGAGKEVGDSDSKAQKGSKGAHGFRDPSPSSAVASNSSSPTSVREDGETGAGASRALSFPVVPVGAVSAAARASGDWVGVRAQTETSISAPGRTTLAEGAHRNFRSSAGRKESSTVEESNRSLVSISSERSREASVSPHPTNHEVYIAGIAARLSSIPGHVLRKTVSTPTMPSLQGSRVMSSSRVHGRSFSGPEGASCSLEIPHCVAVGASTSSTDITDELFGTKVRLGGNRDLLLGDEVNHVDESDEDEYESEGDEGTIGAEPPPGVHPFDSQEIDLDGNSTREIAAQSAESGTASSMEALRNRNSLGMGSGQFPEENLTRPGGDYFSVETSDSGSVTSGVTKVNRQAKMVVCDGSGEDDRNIAGMRDRRDGMFEVDEVAATVTDGIGQSRSSGWNVQVREYADSLQSGGGRSGSSGGGEHSRGTSRSVSRRDMNVVSPFSMEIPGPRRRLGSSGTMGGVGFLLPRVGSARRFFEKQPPPMYGSKVTLFHSVLKPGRCYSLLRELLEEYGCAIQGPSAQRGRKRFTMKCEVKKDEVNIGAVIRICGYDDVLSSITFKKRAGCDSDAFEGFYTVIHERYRERSKELRGSSSLAGNGSGSEKKAEV